MPEQLELLPLPPIAPSVPKHPSHPYSLLQALLRGQVDQPQWSAMGMGWRLAAAVYDLNQLGWCIETTLVPTALPSGRPIAVYKLPSRLRSVARDALKGRK